GLQSASPITNSDPLRGSLAGGFAAGGARFAGQTSASRRLVGGSLGRCAAFDLGFCRFAALAPDGVSRRQVLG
ncbi:hypothetical protein ACFVUZ_36950, partial [Kitasatospora sp. NPDC058060]|uniref:hypothetical protein n=1 Tax=Kitasatospora sp. NPDC058060 TaxID=3346318 RepID=UPI0036E0FE73